jgi:general secretion pathway protein H
MRTMGSGFTLIEILVVLVVIGIVLVIAQVNLMPDDRRVLDEEADRMALLFELANDTAATRSLSLSWAITPQGYAFSRQDERGNWVQQGLIDELRARTLPEGVRIVGLNVQHQVVPLTERLLFSPSGVGTAFEIALALKQYRVRIISNPIGRVWVEKDAVRP